ncbi:MAG: hypothetical protein ACOCTR_05120 [Candidatus Natronoplasma sp.]
MSLDTEKDEERLIELSEKGLSLKGIAEEMDEPLEEIREFIMGNSNMTGRVEDLALESKAFDMFKEGKKAKELVSSGFCPADKAEALYEKYSNLEDMERKTIEDKLATQIGLLGSRLAQLEMKVMDSTLLPKTYECPTCGYEGKYAVALVCVRCENVNIHAPDAQPRITSTTKPLLDHLAGGSEDEKTDEEDENPE